MKSRKVTFTDEAISDLRGIREYIGWDDPAVASRVASEIVSACDRLASFAERGRAGRTDGTREIVAARRYIIVYRISGIEVQIVKIWHGARDRIQAK